MLGVGIDLSLDSWIIHTLMFNVNNNTLYPWNDDGDNKAEKKPRKEDSVMKAII